MPALVGPDRGGAQVRTKAGGSPDDPYGGPPSGSDRGDPWAPCSARRWGYSAVDRPSAKSDSVVTFEPWPVSHGESN